MREVTSCEWCRQHNIKCTPTDTGARCLNCKAKHYKCSLVPTKEGLEMKTTPSGARLTRIAVGGPTKVQEKKEAAKKAKAFRGITLSMFFFLFFLVFTDVSFQTQGVANSLGRSTPLSPRENSSKRVRGFVAASTPSSGDWRLTTTSCGWSSTSGRLVRGP